MGRSQPHVDLTYLCLGWKVCRGSRDVVTSCVQDLWNPTNHNWGITVAWPDEHVLNKLNTSKHWMTVMVKILQPETQGLHSRNFFKKRKSDFTAGFVPQYPQLWHVKLWDRMEDKAQQWPSSTTHNTGQPCGQMPAVVWQQQSCSGWGPADLSCIPTGCINSGCNRSTPFLISGTTMVKLRAWGATWWAAL